MKECLMVIWVGVGILLCFLLGTLIGHVLSFGWFTPVG